MDIQINTQNGLLETGDQTYSLYSPEAFKILSKLWLQLGWNAHYHYTFTWCGRPVLQLPEDLIRLQEVLWELKPDVIIETGIALGGSQLFYASLCQLMGKGKSIGIDIDLRPHNRKTLEEHPLYPWMHLVDGSSIDPAIFAYVQSLIQPGDTVFVILDSNHSKDHVYQELKLFSQLVSEGSYIVVTDGLKQDLASLPRGKKEWEWDNPQSAVELFLKEHPEFILDPPSRQYNHSRESETVTHFQKGWLRRKNEG